MEDLQEDILVSTRLLDKVRQQYYWITRGAKSRGGANNVTIAQQAEVTKPEAVA
jgi:hypothetical protein